MAVYFYQPLWFCLIPALLLFAFIYKRVNKKDRNQNNPPHNIVSVYLPSFFNGEVVDDQIIKSKKTALNWLLVIFMTTALAQPATKTTRKNSPDTLRDIVFVIDTSVGMSLSDYTLGTTPIDRLSLLKAVLTDFLTQLDGNRIGIMVYADSAYTLTPLTRDKNLLSHSISRIQFALAGRQNNLSNALGTVLQQFDFKKNAPSVVVLSQGANIEGDTSPLIVADKFKAKNIKLHVIGLGSNKTTDNSSNRLIFDSIDNKLLQEIANKTNGEFFWVGKSNNLDSILDDIISSETIEISTSEYDIIKNYYAVPLYLSLIILLLTMIKNTLLSRAI
ncbi:MAG: VWA domain-containing protein [Gammaproteobacteria bacterium]|nr:VWA domain-containing protein [Gammaproteobacteria bacterium]